MSLTTCIKKAGAALHADDKNAILAKAREMRAAGESTKDAATHAVQSQLEAVHAMLRGLGVNVEVAPEPVVEAAPEAQAPAAPAAPAAPNARTRKIAEKAKATAEAAANAEGEQQRPETPVENFGEELPPARRAMAAKLDESLSDADIANRPFSEVWPLAENEAIEDTFAAAAAHASRAEVPAKPRVAYKLKRWVDQVKTLRSLASMIVSGQATRERIAQEINTSRATLKDWWSKVQLLEQLPRDQWKRVGDVEERPNSFMYGPAGEVLPNPTLRISIDGQPHYLKADGTAIGNLENIRGLLGAQAPEQRMEFEIRQSRSTGEVFINKAGDGQRRRLMTFATVAEARKAMSDQYDSLVAAWQAVKDQDNITERDLRSEENRPRVGKDRRQGRDVQPEEFQGEFGFRGGEFGKWMKQGKGDQERQATLNSAYDALMDLADLIGVPPKAISLNGTLGIAFGSRGSGWASAHYEPSNLVINLTKTRGAGALAHEWFHALDNYFSRQRGGEVPMSEAKIAQAYRDSNYITHKPEPMMVRKDGNRVFGTMSAARLEAKRAANSNAVQYQADKWQIDPRHRQGVRPEVEQRFAALVQALNDSPMTQRAVSLDGRKTGGGYWSSTLERAARAFESFVQARMQEQGYHNDFLANVKPVEETGRNPARYPYLLPGEVKPVAEAFDALFDTIDTKETNAGTAMFSVDGGLTGADNASYGQATQAHRDLANQLGAGIARRYPGTVFHAVAPRVGQEGRASELTAVATVAKRLFGHEVVFVKFSGQSLFNGAMSDAMPGKVFLRVDSPRPLMAVLGHELLHQLRATNPGIYAALNNRLAKVIENGDRYRAALQARYDERGASSAGVKFDEELHADIVGDFFMDDQFWKDMAAEQPGLFKRVANAILAFLDNAIEQMGGLRPFGTDQYLTDIKAARAAVADAMRQFSGTQVGAMTSQSDGINLSAAESFDDYAKAYSDGLTRYTHKQWVQVHSPEFKAWWDTNANEVGNNGNPSEDRGLQDAGAGAGVDHGAAGRPFVEPATGLPRIFHHGTRDAFTAFDAEHPNKKDHGWLGRGNYVTSDPWIAETYSRIKAGPGAPRVMDLFVRPQKLFEMTLAQKAKLATSSISAVREFTARLKASGYSGTFLDFGDGQIEIATFDAYSIKSATDNSGAFNSSSPDINFSLADSLTNRLNDARDVKLPAGYVVSDLFDRDGKLGWWHKTVGTMSNLAKRSAPFKRVYDGVQNFLNDVSSYATEAADLAPRILPKLETWKDIGKSPISAEDTKAIGAPIWSGTLTWARDERGQPVKVADRAAAAEGMPAQDKARELLRTGNISEGVLKMWQGLPLDQYTTLVENKYERDILKAGIVWTDAELRDMFKLTPEQIGLYREFRASVDRSLTNLAVSDMLRFGGEDVAPVRAAALRAKTVDEAAEMLRDHLYAMAEADPEYVAAKAVADTLLAKEGRINERADKLEERIPRMAGDASDIDAARAKLTEMRNEQAALKREAESAMKGAGRRDVLTDTGSKMIDKAERATDLMKRGYAPLSRFGTYTLDVVNPNGERVYFGMFESTMERSKMARRMQSEFQGAEIRTGTISEEAYKLFAGVTPETLELFGGMLGLEAQGDGAGNAAFQAYLKLAKANRSAMKRLIERKGIAGFSEDAGRVLAGFVYSNARQTSLNLHAGEVAQSVKDIPQGQGELQDAAVKLRDYVSNPQEEAQSLRGLLFTQYLGGSVASAIVNLTQPLAVTFPYLSQYGGAVKAGRQMGAAVRDALKKSTGDSKLDEALKRAEAEGIVSPQEVHQLMAQAQGRSALKSGDGTLGGDALAAGSNALSKLGLAWGRVFGLAEQHNRRVTFIAAYRTAVDQGIANPAKFAEQAVNDTQFVFNKGEKPRWARGAVGGTLFTFKQYSVNYVQLLHRMATAGEPGSPERAAGRKAALLALAVLFLMSGADGLPFAEDIEDVIDGALQRLGYNFSTKAAKREFFANVLGRDLGRVAEKGITGLPGAPIDLSGRLGLGNLIPGTGLLVKKADHTSDVLEFAGPAADLAQRVAKAGGLAVSGEVGEAIRTVAPTAARNAYKAYDMLNTGMYRDDRGRKVIDTDGVDAAFKGIGFQPNNVARVQEATGQAQQMIAQAKLRETEIADQWAKALFEKDADGVKEAKADLARWNDNNPTSPIRIAYPQLLKRLRSMNMDKETRIAKTAPAEIRSTVRRELAGARE